MNTQNGTEHATEPDLSLGTSGVPQHVAIIMDGNGRWARSRFFQRVEGHRAGARAVRMVVEESRRLGVRYLTLFSFSTENWLRPKDEVSALMALFTQYLESEVELLMKHGIRLRAIGDLSRMPIQVQEALSRTLECTAHCRDMELILALSYGGREELTYAMRSLARDIERGALRADQITQEMVRERLYAPDVPDPDLLIRTSEEYRISNFLLWQLAYSEIVVTPVLWPDFSREEFQRCIREYSKRVRRFGLTDEQLRSAQPLNGARVQYVNG